MSTLPTTEATVPVATSPQPIPQYTGLDHTTEANSRSPSEAPPPLLDTLTSSLNSSGSATSDFDNENHWPDDLKDLRANFLLAKEKSLRDQQLIGIRELIKKFGSNKISKHQFEWVSSYKTTIPDGWLPIYKYNTNVKTIRDIWTEFADGVDGQFSVRQLEDNWGARWRRNVHGQKTEATRRNVITNIITSLAQKPRWTVQLALEYLDYQYPIQPNGPVHLRSPRSFITYLQNREDGARRREEVMENAAKYTK